MTTDDLKARAAADQAEAAYLDMLAEYDDEHLFLMGHECSRNPVRAALLFPHLMAQFTEVGCMRELERRKSQQGAAHGLNGGRDFGGQTNGTQS